MSGYAQQARSYKLFCPDLSVKPRGFTYSINFNQMSATPVQGQYMADAAETTSYLTDINANGKLGLGAELGAFVIPKFGLFRLVDIGIGYRRVSGEEQITGFRAIGGDLSFPDQVEYTGAFKYHRIYNRFNAQVVWMLGDETFLHHGPGLYIEQTIKTKTEHESGLFDFEVDAPHNPFSASFNYTAGITFKSGRGSFLDFYVMRGVYDFHGGGFDTSERIFNADYQSLQLGVRFMYMKRTADRICTQTNAGNGGRLPKRRGSSGRHPW